MRKGVAGGRSVCVAVVKWMPLDIEVCWNADLQWLHRRWIFCLQY